MKKKRNKKKLPRYSLGTMAPRTLGYLRNQGAGNAAFTVTDPGEDLNNATQTIRQTAIPKAINSFLQTAMPGFLMLNNYDKALPASTPVLSSAITFSRPSLDYATYNTLNKIGAFNPIKSNIISSLNLNLSTPTFTPTFGTLSNPLGNNVGTLAAKSGAEFFGTAPLTAPVGSGASSTIAPVTSNAAKSSASTALGAGTKALGILAAAYGLSGIAQSFIGLGDHINTGQIGGTRSTILNTTPLGNQYTTLGGVNRSAIDAYERAMKLSKRYDLLGKSVGTGLSIGGLFGLPGAAIGAGAGALFAGLSSLFGFGDNSDEVARLTNIVADNTSMSNQQSTSLGKTEDARLAFYTRGVANGQRPVYTPFGLLSGKQNAWLSHGETIVHPDGSSYTIPGKPDKKDTVPGKISPADAVLSNNGGSQYYQLTGDLNGALAIDDNYRGMKKYCKGKLPFFQRGKLPKFSIGLPGYAMLAVPHTNEIFDAWSRKRQYENANVNALNPYIRNDRAFRELDRLNSLKFDITPYENRQWQLYNQEAWNINRTPGLGTGGRAIAKANLYNLGLKSLRDMYSTAQIENNKLASAAANAGIEVSNADNAARMKGLMAQDQARILAEGRRFNAINSANATMNQGIAKLVQDLWKGRQYDIAQGWQDRQLSLFERGLTLEEKKLLADMARWGVKPIDLQG